MELSHLLIGLLILFVISLLAGLASKVSKSSGGSGKKGLMYRIDRMDGLAFEAYLEKLFKDCGYKAKQTKGSGDFGADLIVHTSDNKKIVVQAKRYAQKNTVGLKAVQEVYASARYYNADVCCVVTTSFYTQQANVLAKSCDVQLINRHDLIEIIKKKQVKFY